MPQRCEAVIKSKNCANCSSPQWMKLKTVVSKAFHTIIITLRNLVLRFMLRSLPHPSSLPVSTTICARHSLPSPTTDYCNLERSSIIDNRPNDDIIKRSVVLKNVRATVEDDNRQPVRDRPRTSVDEEEEERKKIQRFNLMSSLKLMAGNQKVVCHS